MATRGDQVTSRSSGWSVARIGRRPLPWRALAFDIVVGIVTAGIALAVKGMLVEATGEGVAYLPMFAALPIAALIGGLPAGATLVIVSALADVLIFHGPPTWFADDPGAFVRFILFIPIGLWLVWLIASLATLRREARLQADAATELLDAFPDVAVLVDDDLRIERANRRLADHGWDPAALVGQPADVILPRLSDALREEPEGDAATIDLVGRDGTEVPVDVVRARVTTATGSGLLISARDVRERIDHEIRLLRLASTERRMVRSLQAILASMDEAVAVTGPEGDMILTNDVLTAMTGGPVPNRTALETALRVPLVSGDIQQPDGGRWLRLTVREEDDAGLIIARDITEERAAAVAQEAFIGVLSHELRTPVTTILGIAHLLTRSRGDGTAHPRELTADLQAEAGRLDDLIEDLLVLSRAQAGTVVFEPEPVLVQHAIVAAVEAEAARYPAVEFRSDIAPGLPPVSGDKTFLDQVLRNLIGNAGKYSVSTNDVLVTAVERDAVVEVSVLDRGPGFDARDTDRLFDLYFRSATTARTKAGSGIGLYVARTLVEAMGGRIEASLRDPRGAAFTFTLPVMRVDEAEVADSIARLRIDAPLH